MSLSNRSRAEMAVAYGMEHGKTHDQIVDMLDADGLLTPAPQVIRTVEELEALDPETIVQRRPQYPGQYSRTETAGDLAYVVRRWGATTHLPAVVVATGEQVRAARKALEEA